MFTKVSEYIVLKRTRETPSTTTLSLTLLDGSIPHYRAGQCITVYFLDLSTTLGKQYSISSAPRENTFSITVKSIGRFSSRLCSLVPGDRILASEPLGTFYPTQAHHILLCAGGIGITPFRSILLEHIPYARFKTVTLLYSSHTSTDMPFGDELYAFSKEHHSFAIERFVTQESTSLQKNFKYRRMRLDDMYNADNFSESEFLISGSLHFVLGIKNMLITGGVKRNAILTESYF